MNYELRTQQFTGPIEKLLELIEEKKLPISDLSLAEVTADFLHYLKTLTNTDFTQTNTDNARTNTKKSQHKSVSSPCESAYSPRLLADFVVIASRLLLIKSKSLLPNFELTEDEEEGIKDLERRIRLYKEFKPAIDLFKKTWEQKGYSVSRPLFHGRPPVFYPSKNLDIKILHQAINSVFEAIKELSPETQTIELSEISLEEKIKEVIKRLEVGIQHFGKLTKEKSRLEVIVFFLALLHLLRDQVIKVEQKQGFSDIMIEKHES
ncbi:MAG TPA: segregation/condensation protein A [Candidatus Wolfebacteria bacterium]|nr:segregation/condensation protein A [Candidatus Wolfebacteria bacterium]